jgi:hypothetical protein
VSGIFPVAEVAGFAGAKRHDQRSNGKRGLIAFKFVRSVGRPGEVEGEKKTNAHHV